jgi:hypothetical protein
LVQAFLKKWWVESDFKVPNLPLSRKRPSSEEFSMKMNVDRHIPVIKHNRIRLNCQVLL